MGGWSITRGSLTRPSPSGKTKLTPLYFGLGTQTAGWRFENFQHPIPNFQAALGVGSWRLGAHVLTSDPRGSRLTTHVEQPLRVREKSDRELQLRIGLHQVLTRRFDAEEVEIDLIANHRADELLILLPAVRVDLHFRLLDEIAELRDHRVGHLESGRQLTHRRRRRHRDARVALAREALRVDVEQLPRVERAPEPRRVEPFDRSIKTAIGFDAAAAVDLAARV